MPNYGHAHRQHRASQLAAFTPGQRCPRCHQPIHAGDPVDDGHHDRSDQYQGLEHRTCNRATAAHRAALRKRPTEPHPGALTAPTQGG